MAKEMTLKSFKIVSVNTSPEKGTVKHPVDEIVLDESGIQGDAHAGTGHRCAVWQFYHRSMSARLLTPRSSYRLRVCVV